jgi:hypothetical protein
MTTRRNLDDILAGLPAETALVIAALVEPPHAARARRLADRDEALRAAAAKQDGESDYARSIAMEAAMGAFLTGWTWRQHRDADTLPEGTSPLHVLLHRALRLNDGKALRWRQILNVIRGTRTPCNFLL